MINYYSGGIVSSDKGAIRELKRDDGLPMNSGEAVIDEEKIRQFFNNKGMKVVKVSKDIITLDESNVKNVNAAFDGGINDITFSGKEKKRYLKNL